MDRALGVTDVTLESPAGRILDGVNLAVSSGEIVALVGENGSGKTMTLRSVAGLEPRASGRIRFMSEDITDLSPERRVRRGISYCPSEGNVFPRMSVRENLATGAALLPGDLDEGIRDVYEMFPSLERLSTRRASSLSGGEQQVLALARAITVSPELLLLDEFSLGLSQVVLSRMAGVVREINASGVTVLFVEQNLRLAADLSDRDYYMYEGRVVDEDVLRP